MFIKEADNLFKEATSLCKTILRNGYDAYIINTSLQSQLYDMTGIKELDIACRNQYSLTAAMNNLFLMDEFAPFHDKCRLGNWIYAEINDSVFMLRLVKIGINYESIDKVTVEFSNVKETYSASDSIKNILNNAQSIAASYPATVRQV